MKQRRVILWISLLLVLISIASGIYLAQVHLRVHTDPAYVGKCDVSATFRCSDVALSKYAVILGVPAAVWSTQKKCWLDGERRPLTQKGDTCLSFTYRIQIGPLKIIKYALRAYSSRSESIS